MPEINVVTRSEFLYVLESLKKESSSPRRWGFSAMCQPISAGNIRFISLAKLCLTSRLGFLESVK